MLVLLAGFRRLDALAGILDKARGTFATAARGDCIRRADSASTENVKVRDHCPTSAHRRTHAGARIPLRHTAMGRSARATSAGRQTGSLRIWRCGVELALSAAIGVPTGLQGQSGRCGERQQSEQERG